MVSKKGQPRINQFVEISIIYKVIHYCNRYNESPCFITKNRDGT